MGFSHSNLQENQYFEDAFRVYEKGVHAFKYPHVKDIWATYLNKFVTRYGGKKLERARDLFEQAISQVNFITLFLGVYLIVFSFLIHDPPLLLLFQP